MKSITEKKKKTMGRLGIELVIKSGGHWEVLNDFVYSFENTIMITTVLFK